MKYVHAFMTANLLFTAPAMAVPTNIGSVGDIHFTLTVKEATCELERITLTSIWAVWCCNGL